MGCLLCAEAFASSKQKGRSNAEAWADCYESLDRGFLAHANAQPDADVARALFAGAWYNPTLLTHCLPATFRPFCAVFSPFFRGFQLPGAKTERAGEQWRKMGEIWGRNGRETAVT